MTPLPKIQQREIEAEVIVPLVRGYAAEKLDGDSKPLAHTREAPFDD